MNTYLKTFGRMFRRHATRLISVILMVLVSVGFTAGIGMATTKIDYSLSDYYRAENVSDIILMNTEGAFSDGDVTALTERYGAENVERGGMLEFEVRGGKATVNDTEVSFTNVPDGIVRVYLFDCAAPDDVTQNTLTSVTTYDTSAASEDSIVVYAERATVQLPEQDASKPYTMSAVITEHLTEIEYEYEIAGQKIPVTLTGDFTATIPIEQEYILGGTVLNPLHMAVRDDPSYTDDPASDDEEEMLPLAAVYYVFGENLVDTSARPHITGTGTAGAGTAYEQTVELDEDAADTQEVAVPASDLLNQIYITLPDRGDYTLFGMGYDDYVNEELAAIDALLTSDTQAAGEDTAAYYEALTMHENFSFESFREYSGKIGSIGYVLMVVFLFVTILVVLSTMTRLLDEERGQIACLLTLGYSPARIISKYLLFALIGTLIGGAGAYFAGLGLARIIYVNFEWNYTLPAYTSHISLAFFFITFAVILIATLAATVIAGLKMTRLQPAGLLRPKAPKAGKKVFLERIPFIWNHLSFKYKSTMRNVLRFFMRFLMTVVSVALSTALVLAGLAVLDCCLFQDIGGAAMIAVAIIVLIFAALLNFVVTYTLTNINISERERELATLMVLGYYDGEVAGYIYREIYITSGIGILFGLPLGCLLCLFVFRVMEFGSIPGISWFVWVLAPILSVIFTILVTLILRHKIVRINMNESLKAIE